MVPPARFSGDPRTAAVVLHYKRADLTLACLKSLLALKPEIPDLYVVDNHSEDESSQRIRDFFEALERGAPEKFEWIGDSSPEKTDRNPSGKVRMAFLEAPSNLGFGGGINLGLRAAMALLDTAYFWVLNNDVEVAPGALEALHQAMREDPRLGVLGSCLTLKHHPGEIQAVGGCYNPWLGTTRHVLSGMSYEKARALSPRPPIDYVVGAAFLVRRGVLDQAGLFPEDYFLYFEDLDFSFRVKRKAPSFRLDYCLSSEVIHREGATTGVHTHSGRKIHSVNDYYAQRNRLRFSRRWYPLLYPLVHLSQLAVWANRLKRREWRLAGIAFGLFWGWVPKSLRPPTP